MYGIELLLEEHQNILKFTDYMNALCCEILEGKEVRTDTFREAIDFVRNYADKHHHGKEEKILFRVMVEHLGPAAEKLVRNGMLVEHDLGRLHMMELEAALEQYEQEPTTANKLAIITHAAGYASLLKRHIAKEDEVVYTFAERSLSDSLKAQVNEETEVFESEQKALGVQEKYLKVLEKCLG